MVYKVQVALAISTAENKIPTNSNLREWPVSIVYISLALLKTFF